MAVKTVEMPPTRADWVYDRLRQAILSGQIAPGEQLVAAALTTRWQVSPTPFREAVQRLAAEGLVDALPQRGARVALASMEDARDIYDLRLLLEPRAVRASIGRSDDAHRAEIRAAFKALSSGGDVGEVIDAHRAFHEAVVARCSSRWLLRFVRTLAENSSRYQFLSVRGRGGPARALGEHKAILDAALAGDAKLCSSLTERHLRKTVEAIKA
jgi:DNA-binding GntR family transcriptional regulator